jgi:DNA-binding HxlR family transcriptional regulator
MREALLYEVGRFSQLQSRLGVARSTLTTRLNQLSLGGLLAVSPEAVECEYQPTDSGRDFLGCLMVAMRWGDRWCFSEGSHRASARHVPCRQPLGAVLRCGECREVVTPGAVTARRPGPFVDLRPLQRHRTPDLSLLERRGSSAIARTLGVIGDYWTSLIIREAFLGTRRFDDFQRNVSVAPNVLSGRLKRLVAQEILYKTPYGDWPVRHEYRLTERGLDLYHVPLAMLTWGQRWLPRGESDIHLTHRTCGRELQTILSCDQCGEPLNREDIDVL